MLPAVRNDLDCAVNGCRPGPVPLLRSRLKADRYRFRAVEHIERLDGDGIPRTRSAVPESGARKHAESNRVKNRNRMTDENQVVSIPGADGHRSIEQSGPAA